MKKKKSKWQKTQENLFLNRDSGVYYARATINGSDKWESLKTNRFSIAEERLARFLKEARAKRANRENLKRGTLTVGDTIKTYLEAVEKNQDLKPRTKEYYQEIILSLRKSWTGLDSLNVSRISKKDCLDWAERFRLQGTKFIAPGAKNRRRDSKGISPTRFNNTVDALRKLFDIAIEGNGIYQNPASTIKKARLRQKKLRLPDKSKFPDFVKAITMSGSSKAQDCADMVCILAYTGARLDEAGRITHADCHHAEGEIEISGDPETATKNWEVRRVPMIPEMKTLLLRLRSERVDEPDNTPILQLKECQKSMDRAARIVGMDRITHHDLRHLFATTCIEAGVDIPTVSRWLGHKDGGALAMKTYGHLRREHSIAQAQKVSFGMEPVAPIPQLQVIKNNSQKHVTGNPEKLYNGKDEGELKRVNEGQR